MRWYHRLHHSLKIMLAMCSDVLIGRSKEQNMTTSAPPAVHIVQPITLSSTPWAQCIATVYNGKYYAVAGWVCCGCGGACDMAKKWRGRSSMSAKSPSCVTTMMLTSSRSSSYVYHQRWCGLFCSLARCLHSPEPSRLSIPLQATFFIAACVVGTQRQMN